MAYLGQQQGNFQPHGGSNGPPPVSPPWYTEWDARDGRWFFVNQQTGERTYTYPGPGYAQHQGSYGGPQGGYGYNQGGYSNQGAYNQGSYNPANSSYQQQEHEKKHGGNGWKYAAAGAAGVAGGALLMYGGHEIKENWDENKDSVERRFDEFGNSISNIPENAAGWTGEQVGRVENFGDSVEDHWDNAVDNVTEFPENAARWTGEKVQQLEDIPQDTEDRWDGAVEGVTDFGDQMGDAYDEGKEQQRYDDDGSDGGW